MQKYNAGALVVYHGKSAQVSAVSADKIEIRIEGGASKSVRAKDIEFLHPGPVSSLPPRALPEPDCCEIMELMEGETFPFSEFAGQAVKRYTYTVTNYPEIPQGVQANLYLWGDQIIGGDVIFTGQGGFQTDLAFPKA